MQTTVESRTLVANEYPQAVTVRAHEIRADTMDTDTAPGPHDFFIVALATCKAQTAIWYAKRHNLPLERADCRVVADNTDERKGVYKMRVELTFHGPLTDEQRAILKGAVAICPIHKLMTTSDVEIEMV